MRDIAVALVILLVALPAWADEAPPNTLTPHESAAGWKLLFDGDNADGLRFRGQATAEQGRLVLGGDVGSRVGPKEPLPGNFELRLEYRITGQPKALVILQRDGFMSQGMSSNSLPTLDADPEVWHELTFTGTLDAQTGLRTLTRKIRVASGAEESRSMGTFQDDRSLSIWLEVMPGGQLLLRKIRLKADAVSNAGLYWLYGVSGALVLLLVVAVVIWRWRRRTAAAVEG